MNSMAPPTTVTWLDLVVADRLFARFSEEAVESAEQQLRDWPSWLRTSGDFGFTCERAAKTIGVPFHDVRRVAMAHLTAVHQASLPRSRR